MLWHRSECLPPCLPQPASLPASLPLISTASPPTYLLLLAPRRHAGRQVDGAKEGGECVSSRSRQTSGRGLWWLGGLLARIAPAAAAMLHPSIGRGNKITLTPREVQTAYEFASLSGRSVSLVLGLLNIALAAAFVIADAAPENGRKFATDELARPFDCL